MTDKPTLNHQVQRRPVIRSLAGMLSIGVGLSLSTVPAAADHQENYAEIEFTDQETGGATVRVDRTLVETDGFITIHTWDLIENQDGPGTIVGVSELLEPGEHLNVPVPLFHDGTGYSPEFEGQRRLERNQRLVAVPHRDMEHTGGFEFAHGEHTDIPFTNGPQTNTNLPVDGAVNDVATVTVGQGNGNNATNTRQ